MTSLIFSASMPPANTAAVLTALEVMQEEPERIARVNQIGERTSSSTACWRLLRRWARHWGLSGSG